ncbi:MAG: InlB B-repeat-containing protein [Alphaproteobacteria bacterium]|nr:InlB B-repeat-containing protein [Alphaproteobacteria bacterium]
MADFFEKLRLAACRATCALFGVVLLFGAFSPTNSFATTCSYCTYQYDNCSASNTTTYTSCKSGYYMVSGQTCGIGYYNNTPQAGNKCCSCPSGYHCTGKKKPSPILTYSLGSGTFGSGGYDYCNYNSSCSLDNGRSKTYGKGGYKLVGWSRSGTTIALGGSATFTSPETLTAVWEQCPAGTYHPTDGTVRANECAPCPAGKYSSAGASSCSSINAGYYNTGCGTSATGAVGTAADCGATYSGGSCSTNAQATSTGSAYCTCKAGYRINGANTDNHGSGYEYSTSDPSGSSCQPGKVTVYLRPNNVQCTSGDTGVISSYYSGARNINSSGDYGYTECTNGQTCYLPRPYPPTSQTYDYANLGCGDSGTNYSNKVMMGWLPFTHCSSSGCSNIGPVWEIPASEMNFDNSIDRYAAWTAPSASVTNGSAYSVYSEGNRVCADITCNTGYSGGGDEICSDYYETSVSYACTAKCNAVTVNNTTRGGSTSNTTLYKYTNDTKWYSSKTDDVTCATEVTTTAAPSKSNAAFTGYYTAADNTTTNVGSSASPSVLSTSWKVTGASTIYAHYNCSTGYTQSGTDIAGTCTNNQQSITLNDSTNGGSGGSSTIYTTYNTGVYRDSARSESMTTIVKPVTKPTKGNATFLGYYDSASGSTQYINANGYITSAGLTAGKGYTSNQTWYAKFSCNTGYKASGTSCVPDTFAITLSAHNGGADGTIYEKYATGWYGDSSATQELSGINLPTRSGYTFRGFYFAQLDDLTATGGSDNANIRIPTDSNNLPSNTTFTANATMHAAWCKDCSAGTGMNCSLAVNSDGTCTYTTSAKDGYTLTAGSGTYNPTGTPNGYSITLNDSTNGGSGGSGTIYTTYNTNVYKDSARANAMGTSANAVTKPSKSYTVTFNVNGGSNLSASSASKSVNFKGYYNSASGTTQYINANGYITSDGLSAGKGYTSNQTWYAQFESNASGTVTCATATNGSGTSQKVLVGWYTDTNYTTKRCSAGGTYTPSKSETLYAKWESVTCSISNGSGTSSVSSNTPTCAVTCTSGYSQSGYTNTTTSFNATGSAGVSTVTSSCSPRTYKVTLDPKRYTSTGDTTGSAATSNGTVEYWYVYKQQPSTGQACWYYNTEVTNSTIANDSSKCLNQSVQSQGWVITKPTLTGYTFGGYYTNKTGASGTQYINANGETQNSLFSNVVGGTTLFAKWTAQTSTVTLNKNTSSSDTTTVATVTATYDSAMPTKDTSNNTLTAPTRNKANNTTYAFNGYYDARTGGTQYYTSALASAKNWNKTGAQTLYAQWTMTCDAGYHVAAGALACSACPAGKYCSGGTAYTYNANTAQGVTGNITAGYFCAGGGKTATPSGTSDSATSASCGKCTSDSTTGRQTYSYADAGSCSVCPEVQSAMSGRFVSYGGWWSNNIHNAIGGCAANFNDSETDSDTKYIIWCMYSVSDGGYGGANSYCQTRQPTSCAAGTYNTIQSTSQWVSDGSGYAQCNGVDCMKTKVCTSTTAGYYSPAGATTQTKCATGSYSSAGSATCTACPAGKTTSGTGTAFNTNADTTCSTSCSSITNLATWNTQTWNSSNNTVSNLCTVATCNTCVKGTGAASCTYNTTGNTCNYTGTCSTGYSNATASGKTINCTANTNTITLNGNGATGGKIKNTAMTSGAVTFTCTTDSSMTLPTWSATDSTSTTSLYKTKRVFKGWATTDSATTANAPSTCPTGNTTYYAVWVEPTCNGNTTSVASTSLNSVSGNAPVCNRSSKAGYYCSATQTGSAGDTSVSVSCSAASNGYYAAAGATSQTACAKGSYSTASSASSTCTACPGGRTTSGTGTNYNATPNTACSETCSSITNLATWATPSWSANSVSNLCTVATCNSCTNGTGVSSCSPTISNNTCTYSGTCATGYSKAGGTDTTSTATCTGSTCVCLPRTYTITNNLNGGTAAYTQVEYLQSDGNVYIDTGIVPTLNTGASMKVALTTVKNADNIVLGATSASAYAGGNPFSINVYGGTSNNGVWFPHGGTTSDYARNIVSMTPAANTAYTLTLNYMNDGKASVNGTTIALGSSTTMTNKSLYVFDINTTNGGNTSYGASAKVYSLIITESGNVTHNYVPARRSDGVLGLYDTVTGEFKTKSGSGTVTAGSDVGTLPATYTYGVGATVAAGTPTRAHSTFGGWCTDSGLTTCSTTQSVSATTTGNKTFYAKWTCNTGYAANSGNTACNAQTSTVTLNKNTSGSDATTVATVTATYDSAMPTKDTSNANLTVPTRDGYTFTGYFDARTNGTKYYSVSGTTISSAKTWNKTGAQTLYAQWSQCTACSGNTGATCNLSVVNNVCTYATSCKTGYNTLANSGKYNASCTANTYSVKYNANATGATGSMSNSSHTYDVSKALTSNAFTNGTKKFLGWSTSSTATSATYTNGQSVSNLTTTNGDTVNLYAVWTDCTACSGNTGATCTLTAPLGVCTYTTSCNNGYYNISNNGKYNASCSAIVVTTPSNHLTYSGSAQTCPGITVTTPASGNTVKYGTDGSTYGSDTPRTITNAGSTTVYYKVTTSDSNIKTGSYTCYMDKLACGVTIKTASNGSATSSGSTDFPSTKTFYATTNAACSLSVSPTSGDVVATAAISSGTVTMTPKKTGTQSVTVTATAPNDNYSTSNATYTLTVNAGTITCDTTSTSACKNRSWTYNGSEHSCGITSGVTPDGATIKYNTDGSNTYTATVPAVTNVADTKTVYYQITASNYTTKTGSYTCTITPATITASASDKALTYNGTSTSNGTAQSCANVTVTTPSGASVTYSTSQNGTYSSTAPTLTTVGSTTVWYKVSKTNYTTTTAASYTCTMNAKAVSCADSVAGCGAKSWTYDGSSHSCGITSVTAPSDATIKYNTDGSNTYSGTVPKVTNVADTKTVYYQISGDNFTTKTGSYSCTITKATMGSGGAGATSVGASGNSKTYDGSALSCDGGIWTGVPSGSTTTYNTDGSNNYTSTIPSRTNAGTTTVYYKITNPNYNDETGTYDCTVNNATITHSAATKKLTWSGSAQSCANVSVTAPASGATVTYSTTQNGTYSSSITMTNAGSQTVYYKVNATNYNEASGSYLCTMIKVTKSDNSKTYDGSALTCNGNVTVSGPGTYTVKYGTTSGTYNLDNAPTITNVADSKTIYYQVTAENYATQTGSFNCTVSNATIPDSQVTISGNALTYNGSAQNCGTVTSGVGGTVTYATQTNGTCGTYSSTKPQMTSVSESPKTICYKISGATNYNEKTGTYSCTMAKKNGTTTLSATSGSVTYPTTSGSFTVTCSESGAVTASSSDTSVATVSVSGTTVTITYKKAGSATITANCGATTNYNASNATYSASASNRTITISSNGGSGTCAGGSMTCSYGGTCNAPSWNSSTCAISNSGKILTGWNTAANGSGTSVALGGSASSVTALYAVWSSCGCGTDTNATCSQDAVSSNTCKYTHTCTNGYYHANNGSSITSNTLTCSQCGAGNKCPAGATAPTACSGTNEWQDGTTATTCKSVDDGKYKNGNSALQNCGSGYFCKNGARTACTTYGTGYTNDGATNSVNTSCYLTVSGGNVRSGTTGTTLTQCAAGTYKAEHKAYYGTEYTCSNCTGRTQYSDTGASECSTVDTGYYTTGCTGNDACTGQSQCDGATYCVNGVQNNCPSGYDYDTTAGKVADTECVISVTGGHYIGSAGQNSTNWGTCAKGSARATHTVNYGSTSACSQCTPGYYAASAGMTQCTAASKGYYVSGSGKTSQDACYAGKYQDETGQSSCKTCPATHPSGNWAITSINSCYRSCMGGSYMANKTDTTCTDVGTGYWAAKQNVYYNNAGTRTACPAGTTTTGSGYGADEAGDCGRILHTDDTTVRLRSVKKTDPAFNVKIGETTYYGNMSTTEHMTTADSTKALKVKNGNTTYYVYDDMAKKNRGYPWDAAGFDINTNGSTYTYNASQMTWNTTFSWGKAYGVAACNSNNGSWATASSVAQENTGGTKCWCKLTSVAGIDTSSVASWVFGYTYSSASGCASYCADDCGYYVRSYAAFRLGVFSALGD